MLPPPPPSKIIGGGPAPPLPTPMSQMVSCSEFDCFEKPILVQVNFTVLVIITRHRCAATFTFSLPSQHDLHLVCKPRLVNAESFSLF